ncbi:MAG: hypothetical protein ACK4UQ_06590 [Brevundimonas sp.]
MSNFTVSRLGQANLTGDVQALFATTFEKEVLRTYLAKTMMKPLIGFKALRGSKSFKFPLLGSASAAYYPTPGVELTGGQLAAEEITIGSDDKLISQAFIDELEEVINHYDVRAPYVEQLTQALAVTQDRNALRSIAIAARDPGKIGQGGGSSVVSAFNTADLIRSAIISAKQKMEEKNVAVDSKPIRAMLKTADYYLYANSDKAVNKDYNGGTGSIAQTAPRLTIDGVELYRSSTATNGVNPFGVNSSADADIAPRYRANFSNTVAVVWSPDAVLMAEVQPVQTQMESTVRNQGTLVVAKWTGGIGTFRPTDAVEIKTA